MRFDFGQFIGLLRPFAAAQAVSKGSVRYSGAMLKAIHMNNH
jgi:hypothetical protein